MDAHAGNIIKKRLMSFTFKKDSLHLPQLQASSTPTPRIHLPHRKIGTQLIDLAPNVWLHSSVGRASHRYRGGHGFESR